MINKFIGMGRITHDLELKSTQSGVAVLSFTVAIERKFQKQGEEKQADFINCVAWRQQAEFISKYFSKGRMIALEGNLRTRAYDDKNGTKHNVTEVYVDSASFTAEPKQGTNNTTSQLENNTTSQPTNNGSPAVNIGNISDFEEILSDDGIPFN